MALSQPVLSFLRPLGPPRPSTFRQFLRFSTATRLRVEASIPPESAPQTLSAQEASRAADLAAAEAATDADNPNSPAPKPTLPSKRSKQTPRSAAWPTLVASKNTTPPPYHVARSLNKNLPVYQDYKRGGNLHQTIIRKITGDLHVLKDEVKELLRKDEKDVKINDLTKQVVIKGHHKVQVMEYLASRGF
ncbi:hypothetical protein GQ43DRAFT_383512 [Delitschia confertaspora ATCC 74209]|uniref:Large ribosomal subunit protein mL49 n=1 Tax=Delitschia confertaspora ATCC 74209 TaxID=1513339 RepID=A0A9P4JBZ4_9PLEO|nr:hypothetical protein GQ43DRAFT_383512 [Delitschia confertaspora ATCC 74209]